MKPALGTHANGLSPTQSVLVVQMGVLLANVKHRGSDAKLMAGDATNGDGGGRGACQWVVASSECACGTRGRAPCKCEALRLERQADS